MKDDWKELVVPLALKIETNDSNENHTEEVKKLFSFDRQRELFLREKSLTEL